MNTKFKSVESKVDEFIGFVNRAFRYKVNWGVARRVGNYAIEPFEISDVEAFGFNLRESNRMFSRFVVPGKYTRLVEYIDEIPPGSESLVGAQYGYASEHRRDPYIVWMSDTTSEVAEHFEAIEMTKSLGGHCLLTGLGIGMVANAMLMEGAETVTVLEINPEVIEMVFPLLDKRWGSRIRVVRHDAFKGRQLPPGTEDRWSVVWHDIWPDICPDNLPQMDLLVSKYADHCKWQGCWNRDICERMKWIEDSAILALSRARDIQSSLCKMMIEK